MTANELRSEIFTKRKNGIANTNNSNFIIDNLDNEQKKLLRMRNDDR